MDTEWKVTALGMPKPEWEFAPTGVFEHLLVQVLAAPNWFHRLMQYLILGVRWRRIRR